MFFGEWFFGWTVFFGGEEDFLQEVLLPSKPPLLPRTFEQTAPESDLLTRLLSGAVQTPLAFVVVCLRGLLTQGLLFGQCRGLK